MAHKTESGNNSGAWKNLENRFAELLNLAGFPGAHRILKETHDSRPDVDVPEIPDLAIDTKYSDKVYNVLYQKFKAQVETYVGVKRKGVCKGSRYRWAVMPIRPKGESDILLVMRAVDFIDMLVKIYVRNEPEPGRWMCPRCPTNLEMTGEMLGLNQFSCPACQLTFITDQREGKEDREMIASMREKGPKVPKAEKVIIKDKSKPVTESPPVDGHRPVPGQIKVADLLQRARDAATNPKPKGKRSKKS